MSHDTPPLPDNLKNRPGCLTLPVHLAQSVMGLVRSSVGRLFSKKISPPDPASSENLLPEQQTAPPAPEQIPVFRPSMAFPTVEVIRDPPGTIEVRMGSPAASSEKPVEKVQKRMRKILEWMRSGFGGKPPPAKMTVKQFLYWLRKDPPRQKYFREMAERLNCKTMGTLYSRMQTMAFEEHDTESPEEDR